MEVKDLPAYLERSPLVEAIWEIRFNVNPALSIGDLLPGIVFVHLDAHSKGYVLNQLPFVMLGCSNGASAPITHCDSSRAYAKQLNLRIMHTQLPEASHRHISSQGTRTCPCAARPSTLSLRLPLYWLCPSHHAGGATAGDAEHVKHGCN